MSTVTPLDRHERRKRLKGLDIGVYQAVAARRAQWDNLVWQVPVVSLTGQAFLFTIALSAGNSQLARAVSAALALIAALLSMALMTRHRLAEITDAHWLEDYENANFGDIEAVHGEAFRHLRESTSVGGRRWHEWFAKPRGYDAWMAGFALFAIAAGAILVLVFAAPDAFG